MSSLMGSRGLVLATAMALSAAGTFILFDHLREKYLSIARLQLTQKSPQQKPILKSCLSSGGKRMKLRRKQKKVCFAADVKDSNSNGKEYRKEYRISCEKNILGMQANRRALYTGILKHQVHRMEFFY